MAYEVKLNSFEGPLDLLLHLIDKAEVDVYDIPITILTEQYMQYLYVMQEFQIDIASEFLVMAATLLEIKSKMLLPRKEEPSFQPMFDLEEEEYDPRRELVERLLEYKKFKTLAEQLREREINQSKVFTRAAQDLTPYALMAEENPVTEVTLYDLVEALTKVFSKVGTDEKPVSKIHRDEVSVKDKMKEIRQLLSFSGSIRFTQLFTDLPSRGEIVTSFMAILEMMRKHQIVCSQSTLFEDIIITLGRSGGENESE